MCVCVCVIYRFYLLYIFLIYLMISVYIVYFLSEILEYLLWKKMIFYKYTALGDIYFW